MLNLLFYDGSLLSRIASVAVVVVVVVVVAAVVVAAAIAVVAAAVVVAAQGTVMCFRRLAVSTRLAMVS